MKNITKQTNYSGWQVFSLTLLRVLTGWHFLYEGLVKFYTPDWTARAYLANSVGPFSSLFKSMAQSDGMLVIDILNEWGLVLIGLSLFIGLLSKPGKICGIALLLLYYLAYPPFSAFGVNPHAEGSYWIVNKNLIEMAALFVLVLFPSSHITGIDRYLRNLKLFRQNKALEIQSKSQKPNASLLNQLKVFLQNNAIRIVIFSTLILPSISGSFGICCPRDTVKAPGEIPLNNILTDYVQADKIFGRGLVYHQICDKKNWEAKKQSIFNRSKIMLGIPPKFRKGGINPDTLSVEKREGYKEIKIQFPSYTGDTIVGYLLVPNGTTPGNPRPAILAMHSTGPGSIQTVGIVPKENRCYGMELAQLGYVVLAIDVVCAGDRIYDGHRPYFSNEFYKQFPNWSLMGKNIADHQRGLDYLCSLDFVDPDRLGCIGHSLGGYNSFFLLAFDKRIKAAVSSCGFSPMGKTNSPYQFARNNWYIHFNPACRDFISAGMIPCDMHEIMALCAPRPLFNYSAIDDATYYPEKARDGDDFTPWWDTVDKALDQVSQVYKLLGEEENFVRMSLDGGHNFPPGVREEAYKWLDKVLRKNQ